MSVKMKLGGLALAGMLVLSPMTALANEGEPSSYNPTEPEIQVGEVTELGIDVETGAVKVNGKQSSQGIVKEGLTEIEAVPKQKTDTVYLLDKDTKEIYSASHKDGKITDKDGTTVELNFVEKIVGLNGVADADGFKSSVIRDDALPKTGLSDGMLLGMTPDQYSKYLIGLGGILIGYAFMRRP